jgi:hypothetical protein
MAFTTPGTAVAGDVLTAAFWNTNVRDNVNALKDEADAVGLVLVDSHSFTTAATIDRVGVFSAAYTSYRIIIRITALSVETNIAMRLLSGSTAATANYVGGGIFINTATGAVTGSALTTDRWNILLNRANDSLACDITNPNVAIRTNMLLAGSQGSGFGGFVFNSHTASTEYDGFRLLGLSGSPTYTGTVQTYGYRL